MIFSLNNEKSSNSLRTDHNSPILLKIHNFSFTFVLFPLFSQINFPEMSNCTTVDVPILRSSHDRGSLSYEEENRMLRIFPQNMTFIYILHDSPLIIFNFKWNSRAITELRVSIFLEWVENIGRNLLLASVLRFFCLINLSLVNHGLSRLARITTEQNFRETRIKFNRATIKL